eukprot:CAMPEP_0198682216 /NCGR_PEP_ID=MMETSP1468-20131203/8263_1 /TAXON_ID=1461545 /ORGANISM="Mantoniella sp, Strain CCMP1436" /LENGTH=169 /DNA_ID=CAMNT_0044424905 /DNA_START=281 /DNA_END=792 /DNA_ORIENTATION=-
MSISYDCALARCHPYRRFSPPDRRRRTLSVPPNALRNSLVRMNLLSTENSPQLEDGSAGSDGPVPDDPHAGCPDTLHDRQPKPLSLMVFADDQTPDDELPQAVWYRLAVPLRCRTPTSVQSSLKNDPCPALPQRRTPADGVCRLEQAAPSPWYGLVAAAAAAAPAAAFS